MTKRKSTSQNIHSEKEEESMTERPREEEEEYTDDTEEDWDEQPKKKKRAKALAPTKRKARKKKEVGRSDSDINEEAEGVIREIEERLVAHDDCRKTVQEKLEKKLACVQRVALKAEELISKKLEKGFFQEDERLQKALAGLKEKMYSLDKRTDEEKKALISEIESAKTELIMTKAYSFGDEKEGGNGEGSETDDNTDDESEEDDKEDIRIKSFFKEMGLSSSCLKITRHWTPK